MSRPSITIGVLTLNEERYISGCLRGLRWADEVVVLDSGSRDRTTALARLGGARVEHRTFDNYARQRQALVDLTQTDWLLFVDADERVPIGLAEEIVTALTGSHDGYWVPRRNYIWGRWVRGGGWWPDRQLRLVRREKVSYLEATPVHEVGRVDGTTGTLFSALVHYNYETVGEFIHKQRRFSTLAAAGRVRAGERSRFRRLPGAPAREMWRRYVVLGGWRDGWHGVRLAGLSALAAAETELRLLQGLAKIP